MTGGRSHTSRETTQTSAAFGPSLTLRAGGRRAGGRGVTLMEVVIGLFILAIASFSIMELFAQSLLTFSRSKDSTTSTLLAQQKMEELLYLDAVPPGSSGKYAAPFDNFTYAASVAPYLATFNTLTVDVNGPRGAHSRLVLLVKANDDFAGVGIDLYSSSAVAALASPAPAAVDNVAGNTVTPAFSPVIPSLPNNGTATGVAIDEFHSVAFVGDSTNHGLWYYNGSTWQGQDLTTPFQPSPSPPQPMRPAGVCCDANGDVAFVADKANRCLWYFNSRSSSWWPSPLRPPSNGPSLGVPAGVACDGAASTVWVADTTNNCLWYYNDDARTTSAPGTWIQYTSGQFAGPRGVAVATDYANCVYVVDSANVWKLNADDYPTGPSPVAVTLLSIQTVSGSGISMPSGLGTDSEASTFWLNDPRTNAVWYAHVVGPGPSPFVKLGPPP